MTIFRDLDAQAADAIDSVYAEPFTYRPLTTGGQYNARPAPDPAYGEFAIDGVFVERPQIVEAAKSGGGSLPLRIVTAETTIAANEGQFPLGLPRQGDHLVRLHDEQRFRVRHVERNDTARLHLVVERL